jgi:hypothetical protein
VDYDAGLTLERIRKDPQTYLVPEYTDDGDITEVLEWGYDMIFETELWFWYTERTLWPPERDFKMFLDWFDVDFHELVIDLVDAPLEVVDYSKDESPINGSNGN